MVFSNQFALSLELTRLLPPIGRAANAATTALMSHARDLRHSGSDIVVEEDLTNVLGRCRISTALSSSFRTIVTKSSGNISLLEGIMLQGGPGPTVVRAFQEPSYFAMVVQLSLLTWTFEANYLATALADALRKRQEGAPSSYQLQSTPDSKGILGVLKACEAQTSGFNWNMMLRAVSRTLGYDVDKAPIDFPPFVLQSLLDMLPMVQSLPNDRIIHIQIPVGDELESGVVALIVWAHHVLDLTVLVRPRPQQGQSALDIQFGGSNTEQVFIEEVTAKDEACIILLDSQKEHLLKIRPDPDDEDALIGSVKRIPARGWGNALFAESMGGWPICRARSQAFMNDSQTVIGGWPICRTRSQVVIDDLQTVTSAFAFIVARNLVREDEDRNFRKSGRCARNDLDYSVDEQSLLQASRFLFDNAQISLGEIKSFATAYSGKPLNECLSRPPALESAWRAHQAFGDRESMIHQAFGDRESMIQDEWNQICGSARRLSILIIALSHVKDSSECEDLMFASVAFGEMSDHPLVQQLEDWNGRDALRISDDAWLQAIAVPLLGPRNRVWRLPWDQVCLISDRGWSAWISTLGDLDPAYTDAGWLRLGRGRPCRNGVWKTGIWDVTHGSIDYHTKIARVEPCGQAASLRCLINVHVDTPSCGEGEDVFVVCARLRLHRSVITQRPVQRVGYKELQKYLWWAHLTKRCSHAGRVTEQITLAIGCVTVAGFGCHLADTEERIVIYLTAHDVGARWLALAMIPSIRISGDCEEGMDDARQILLRGNDCCFQCAVDQAAVQRGRWFIIL